jgi:predicted N-formylglutamate amidohydrolase
MWAWNGGRRTVVEPIGETSGEAGFRPVDVLAGRSDAGILFVCDHARNFIPAAYDRLGLTAASLERHVAYDIGAEPVTRRLAEIFSAPAIVATYSRLLIDPNRGADDPTLVMRLSDGLIIPGNAMIDEAEIGLRRQRYWQPYRDAVSTAIEAMVATGTIPVIVSIHSFTRSWKGFERPWHISVLWDKDPRLAVPLLSAVAGARDIIVGDNEPYDGALEGDTLHQSATRRGLANALIEIRQDLIAEAAGARQWADRLARSLAPVLVEPDAHMVRHYGSRTQTRTRRRSADND